MADSMEIDWNVPRDVAIPRLIEMHGDRLYALGRRICGSNEEAEDLVQEIFLQAWRAWGQFEGRSDPIVWLYTIGRRTCQKMHRRRVGEPARLASLDQLLPFGDPKMAVPPDPDDPASEQIRREQREQVEAAIVRLPSKYRMALVLKDIVGFSVAEVAEILDVKPVTVRTRVHRARLVLRRDVESGLAKREMAPPAYSRQVCLDLLRAKQDCMDRGVPMPNADQIICERCQAVFGTLDLTRAVCAGLADARMPDQSRTSLRQTLRLAGG